MNARSVFELYAHEYDLITDAAAREASHRREIRALIDRFSPQTVLDAGCATGLTTRLLAEEGLSAVGVDRSRTMIARAKKKYGHLKLPLKFQYGRFENLPRKFNGEFDMVVCLANSISGVGTRAGLLKSLTNFYRVLSPKGVLVLQMLNYRALKENQLFPIKATENDGIVYVRFAERVGNKFAVYVTRVDLNKTPAQLEPFRTLFGNFEVDVTAASFKKASFKQIQKFGNLTLSRKFTARSRDLVIIGRKSES